MSIEAFEAEEHGRWIVEGINEDGDGEVYWASFYGWNAQERAKDYAIFLASKPEGQPSPGLCSVRHELTNLPENTTAP